MKRTLSAAALVMALGAGQAQVPMADPGVARSVSGQFIVRADRSAARVEPARNLATNQSMIRLEPSLVSVSCERIRKLIYRELQTEAPWRGKVFVVLYPAHTKGEPVTLTSERFRDGWQYRVDLPDLVERSRYISAIVQAVLQEIANRNGGLHSAELPAWLIAGLSQQLQIAHGPEILLAPPPQAVGNGLRYASTDLNGRKEPLLEQAHRTLATHSACTFEQLSWPLDAQLSGPDAEVYRCSAQLFVHALLELDDGRACLQSLLADLPGYYNWQLAFLHAFRAHFARPLDTEKWWALQVQRFTGRELAQTWSAEQSWQRLEETLRLGMQVRTGTNELPSAASVSLQTCIREWARAPQTEALQGKLRELDLLRVQTVPELATMLNAYRQVLVTYLQERDRPGPLFPLGNQSTLRRKIEETVRQLDALDARRLALRSGSQTLPVPTQARF
jgi:hypothetical protein